MSQTQEPKSGQSRSRSDNEQRYLSFSLGAEAYAVPLLTVREVIALTDVTPVPGLPTYVKGILNLRGEVISVVDLRTRFRMAPGQDQTESAILILDVGRMRIGAIVDSIDCVLALTADRINPVAAMGTAATVHYVQAIARLDQGLVSLLDVEKCLGVEQFAGGSASGAKTTTTAA